MLKVAIFIGQAYHGDVTIRDSIVAERLRAPAWAARRTKMA
jgi:hypothetical protein